MECIVNMFIIDFDDTLFDTHRYKKERFAPLENFGISHELAQSTYRQIRTNPEVRYTNEAHAQLLATLGYSEEKVLEALRETSGSMIQKFVFPDAHIFLEALKKKSQPLILVTLGDPIFQKQKVVESGLWDYFDEWIFPDSKKVEAVETIIQSGDSSKPTWFINDKIEESLLLKQKYPDLQALMKISPEFESTEYKSRDIPSFQTLTEILNYINHYGQE